MAMIFKVSDGKAVLEVGESKEEGLISFWIGRDDDMQSWNNVELDKDDVAGLIKYLQEQL